MQLQISPSLLSADFGCLNAEIASIAPYADSLHFDIMDGHFVPNLTFGASLIKCLNTRLPKNCHLMVTNPEKYLQPLIAAGAAAISFHIEVVKKPQNLLRKIQKAGLQAGIAINPKTPVSNLKTILPLVDFVLVMTVEPGFGGQKFLAEPLKKITWLRKNYPDLTIEVDGGINAATAKKVVQVGANVLISGSYIFQAKNRQTAIAKLRENVKK